MAARSRWSLEVFVADNGREPFTAFTGGLSDTAFAALDAALRHVLSPGARRQSQVFAGAYDLAVQFIELRERRGMTQTELALVTGLNQADISRIEDGAANPTERTLLRIADALDADLRLVERPAS